MAIGYKAGDSDTLLILEQAFTGVHHSAIIKVVNACKYCLAHSGGNTRISEAYELQPTYWVHTKYDDKGDIVDIVLCT